MERKSIVIDIPDGMCIDESKSTFEKIVFKKKEENTKPRSWKEYCKQQQEAINTGYFIKDANCDVREIYWRGPNIESSNWKNVLPSKELAEVFLAMMQLMSLRQAWIGDWEPDWSNVYCDKYCIECICCHFEIQHFNRYRCPLSFPTEQMAEDFMNCFKDLLEIAKPLI